MKLVYLSLMILLFTSCKNGKNEMSSSRDNDSIPAVIISTGTAVRETPSKDGKWISSMLLGEKLTYLGESAVDSANPEQEYLHVELSDGKQAWARSYGVLINAIPAAVISQTAIYKRPDLVTQTDKTFRIAEFVAIISDKGEWVEVIGAEKRKSGWIKRDMLSIDPEDVAVATLAHKDLLDKEGKIIAVNLSTFLENLPNVNSQLARSLQDQMSSQVEDAIEQSIRDYETEDGNTMEESVN
jgi:hypothetical protein